MEAKDETRIKLKNENCRVNQVNIKQEHEEQQIPHWMRWCRLCAKEDERNNFNAFYRNQQNVPDRMLTTAIRKYFGLNIKSDDENAQFICNECHKFVDTLVIFTERVNKVQTMFYVLQNSKSSDPINAIQLRSQYGLLDEERQHVIKPHEVEIDEEYEAEDTKPTLIFEVEEDNDVEQEMDDCYEEYKQASKEFEQHKNVDPERSLSNEVELFSENETLVARKKVDLTHIKKFFKKEKSISLDEKITNNSEIDENDDVIFEHTVDDEADDDNIGVDHIEDIHHNTAKSKLKHISSSKKIVTHAGARPKCKRGRPHKYRCAEENYEDELKQTYPCPYCDKKLTKEIYLSQHIQGVHLNERPFICTECGRALKTNAALKEHQLTHTNDYPFECLVCHKRFKNNARLKMHMDTHNATVYTCDECGLQLKSRRTLNMHMRVHSTAKPYKCDYCGTEFKRARALKIHLIIHTGLKPYTCEFCNKAFANGSNCRTHKKKAHPDELAAAEAQGISPRPNNVPKLNHLREVTKHSKNLKPVNKQVGLPSNWRKVLLKSEALSERSSSKTTDDTQHENEDDIQQEYDQETQHQDEGSTIITENMVSDGKMAE